MYNKKSWPPLLQNLANAKTLAHAWLFVSADLSHAITMAQEFSQWLLCLQKNGTQACGNCQACNLFAARSHPDFFSLIPAEDKHTITIDAVRDMCAFVPGKPQISAHKIVLLYPAEAMPKQSANALLKNLEEPLGDTIYILLTKQRELLLKTIISRCQVLMLPQAAAVDPQSAAQGANITQQMQQDLMQLWCNKAATTSHIAESWVKQWPSEVLYWFDTVLTDLIRFKYTQNLQFAKGSSTNLATLSTAHAPSKLWDMLAKLRQAQYWQGQKQNPNLQLVLEDLLGL